MNDQNAHLLLKDIDYLERIFEQIYEQHPELKSLIEELLYPMEFLQRVSCEATGVLNNDVNSIEQMRFLLYPALVEGQETRDVVSDLLPCESHGYDELLDQLDVDDSFIHFGELVLVLLAAGRAGMKTFNLSNAIEDFIDVVKFSALATLPLQILAGVLRTGRQIDNFIQSYLHLSKSRNSHLFLKILVKTFWDRRGLASALSIEILANEVKKFFNQLNSPERWDGSESIHISAIDIVPLSVKVKHPLRIQTDFDGSKDTILTYYVWDSVNDGDNLGIVTRCKVLQKNEYQKQGSTFYIPDHGFPSGWISLRSEKEREVSSAFAAELLEYWSKFGSECELLSHWPIPLSRLPSHSLYPDLPPIIRRENVNRWGPEFIDEKLHFYTDTSSADVDYRIRIDIQYRSHIEPEFRVSTYESMNAKLLNINVVHHQLGQAIVNFSLSDLDPADTYVLLHLHTNERPEAYDTELKPLGDWLAYIKDEGGDSTGSDNQGDGDNDETPSTDTPDSGTGGHIGGVGASDIPIVLLRPPLLDQLDKKATETHWADVHRLSHGDALIAIENLSKTIGRGLPLTELPFIADNEISLHMPEHFTPEVLDGFIHHFRLMAESGSGPTNAVWIVLMKAPISFYRVALTPASTGLIVATADQLSAGWEELKRRVLPDQEYTPEAAITVKANVFNGALSIDKFVNRQMRLLANNDAPIPSQWIALGYSTNRQLLFEKRINLPRELFNGSLVLNLPDHSDLEKIELRYQPELFAIEIASVTQPRLTEASVRLLSNASVLRGATFRQVTPMPKRRLISLQRKSGDVSLLASYDRHRNQINWRERHSTSLETRVKLMVENSQITRVINVFDSSVSGFDLNNLLLSNTQVNDIQNIRVVVSDGWSSKAITLETDENAFQFQYRDLLPRRATSNANVYWVDIGQINQSISQDTRVNWLVNGENIFAESVSIFHAVKVPVGTQPQTIKITLA